MSKMKADTWKTILQIAISILTALATSLGVSSCMGWNIAYISCWMIVYIKSISPVWLEFEFTSPKCGFRITIRRRVWWIPIRRPLHQNMRGAVVFCFSSVCFQFLYHEKVSLREGVIKFHPYHHFSEYFLYFCRYIAPEKRNRKEKAKKRTFLLKPLWIVCVKFIKYRTYSIGCSDIHRK